MQYQIFILEIERRMPQVVDFDGVGFDGYYTGQSENNGKEIPVEKMLFHRGPI
jgi:hypothetical protein